MEQAIGNGNGNGKRALVVYYSRKGHVARVAEAIAQELGADTERLVDKTKRSGILGLLSCGRDASREIPADIEEPQKDPAAYDLVVVGTPVWNAHMSTPVLAYLKKHSGRLPRTAFFMTCFGRYKQTFETMGAVAGKTPLATMVVLNNELARGRHRAKVREFVAKLTA